MKLILVTATLLLSVTFAELISNEFSQTLTCYGSNGWNNWPGNPMDPPDIYEETTQCPSRCYAARGKSFLIKTEEQKSHNLLSYFLFSKKVKKYFILLSLFYVWVRQFLCK